MFEYSERTAGNLDRRLVVPAARQRDVGSVGLAVQRLPRRDVHALQASVGNAAVVQMLRAGTKPHSRMPAPHVPNDIVFGSDGPEVNGPGAGAKVPLAPSAAADIPMADGSDERAIDTPPSASSLQRAPGGTDGMTTSADGGTPATGGGRADAADSCGAPMSMTKVTGGPLGGGLDMATYYPDLVGKGYWAHGTSGGPFDTGTRAGSNVQLNGTVPSPCEPDQFRLGQTVTYTKRTFNGVRDPQEGKTFDDIAKSGRDASKAPFRQLWLGDGLNISMADPPSADYSSLNAMEMDRDFTTSLTGPSGSKSVSWSTSIRVVNGSVTKNTVS